MRCKRCEAEQTVKNGFVRQKQRWLCKSCGLNFVEGDERKTRCSDQRKALAVLLVCLGLGFRAAGIVVGVVRNTVYEWYKDFAQNIELPTPDGPLDVVELDEMWHFLKKIRQALDLESHNDSCWYNSTHRCPSGRS